MRNVMPIHHPSLELLLSVAAGDQTPAVHKVVLAHAALCPACRAELDKLEAIGGAMLDKEVGVAMNAGALERALTAVGESEKHSAPPLPDWLHAVPASVRDLAAEVAHHAASPATPSLKTMQSM